MPSSLRPLAAAGSKAVFFDRKGTLPDGTGGLDQDSWTDAVHGLSLLQAHGYKIILIHNATGALSPGISAMTLKQLCANEGIILNGSYRCPQHPCVPAPECECCLPGSSLLTRAAAEHGVDLARSWMVGPILDAIEAGRRAQCRTILHDRGLETQWQMTPLRSPHHVVRSLQEAAHLIVSRDTAVSWRSMDQKQAALNKSVA